MSSTVLFEHPLNEKMRTWLRVEFLLQQLAECMPLLHSTATLTFFRTVSELLDIFERGDIRPELLKELERQQQKLRGWAEVPGVDTQVVEALHQRLRAQAVMLNNAPRMGYPLRKDRLISLVRQRLSIPGGCCSFDLPALHIWLHQPQALRDAQVNAWTATLEPLQSSLAMVLDLIRQSAAFQPQVSLNGFYQDNAEGADLLRMRLPLEQTLYPQVSGHKSRFAIRFLPLDSEHGEVPAGLNFELACC